MIENAFKCKAMGRFIIAWFGIMILAIANGAMRNLIYTNVVGELRAHQISTLTLIILMFLFTYFIRGWLNIHTNQAAWECGLLWFGMTVLFEFGFGHWVAGKSFTVLLHDYNFFAGRLWSLVLLFTLILPFIIKQLSTGKLYIQN